MTKTTDLSRRHLNATLAAGFLAGPAGWGAAAAVTPKPGTPQGSPSARLARIADDYHKGRFALFPLEATENTGDPAYEALFEVDIAPEHRERQERFYKRTLAALKGIGPDQLS